MASLTVNEVKKKHQAKIMAIPGVVGIGIGEKEGADAIIVLVVERTKSIEKQVPPKLDGFPVVIQETGVIRAL